MKRSAKTILKGYAYAWLTLAFFLGSLLLHWWFGWYAFVGDAAEHGQTPEVSNYLNEMLRDTFENWQSEFLQLLWQVGGLAILLYVGSPQSKEGDDRMEAKIDEILRKVDPQNAERIIETLDEDYAGRHTDARHAHR